MKVLERYRYNHDERRFDDNNPNMLFCDGGKLHGGYVNDYCRAAHVNDGLFGWRALSTGEYSISSCFEHTPDLRRELFSITQETCIVELTKNVRFGNCETADTDKRIIKKYLRAKMKGKVETTLPASRKSCNFLVWEDVEHNMLVPYVSSWGSKIGVHYHSWSAPPVSDYEWLVGTPDKDATKEVNEYMSLLCRLARTHFKMGGKQSTYRSHAANFIYGGTYLRGEKEEAGVAALKNFEVTSELAMWATGNSSSYTTQATKDALINTCAIDYEPVTYLQRK